MNEPVSEHVEPNMLNGQHWLRVDETDDGVRITTCTIYPTDFNNVVDAEYNLDHDKAVQLAQSILRTLAGNGDRHPVFIPGYDVSPLGVTPKEIVAWLRDGSRDVRTQAADLIDSLCLEIERKEGTAP